MNTEIYTIYTDGIQPEYLPDSYTGEEIRAEAPESVTVNIRLAIDKGYFISAEELSASSDDIEPLWESQSYEYAPGSKVFLWVLPNTDIVTSCDKGSISWSQESYDHDTGKAVYSFIVPENNITVNVNASEQD